MEYGHMRSVPSSIAKATAGAALALLAIAMGVTAARAASLGKLEIVSGVGEPLRGRIEILGATRHELDTLGARLGSAERYGEAGLIYEPRLERLRFNLAKQPGGRHYIALTSSGRYSEPVLDLVVELAWFGGTASYAYTALVDPAGSETSPSVSAPSALVQTSTAALSPEKVRKSRPATVKGAASAGTHVASNDAPLADEIRLAQGKAEQAKHRLAAAQERVAELERTVQEQEQLLTAAAATALADDRRAAAPGVIRVSHETSIVKHAAIAQDTSSEWGGTSSMAGGGAAAVLAVLLFMRRRGRAGETEARYSGLAPSLQPAR
jgi:Tfp pilus assembly protein FimV